MPIRVTKVNIAWLSEFRDQVWAEALVRYKAGEIWHYEGESAQRLANESRPYQQEDPWEQPVLDYLIRRRQPTVSVLDVLTGCIGVSLPQITRQERSRVSQLLRLHGCEEQAAADGTRPVWAVPERILSMVVAKPAAATPFWTPNKAQPKAEA